MVETELFSKLGTILINNEIPVRNDRRAVTMYSGHPMGLFPSHKEKGSCYNGMVIPNYSKPDDWEKMNALGVSQYGQTPAPMDKRNCTWHDITVLNAFRKKTEARQEDFFLLQAGWHENNPKQEILLVALRFVLRSMQRLHTFVTAKVGSTIIEY
jgi:hypothetical protein